MFDNGHAEDMSDGSLERVDQVFKVQFPPEPVGVTRVRVVGHPGVVYEFDAETGDWVCGFTRCSWWRLLSEHHAGVEPVPEESEYEVAVRVFRKDGFRGDMLERGHASVSTMGYAAAIVREVLKREGDQR